VSDPPRSPPPVRASVPPVPPRAAVLERSAGGVVLRPLESGAAQVLLIRDPYRKWGLPKGHLEEGEGEVEAALREVAEETGLGDLVLGPDLGEIEWTFRKRGRTIHKVCRFFLMTSLADEARPELAEGISEVRWLALSEAMRLIGYENARGVLRRAAVFIEGGEGTASPAPDSLPL